MGSHIYSKQNVSASYLTNKYWVIVIALFCSVLWGSAFPVLKVSYLELGIQPDDRSAIIVFAGVRFFLASMIIFSITVLGFRQSPKVRGRVLPQLLLLGILQISLQYFFFYNGLAHTSGMKAAILSSASTFFVVVLAHFAYANDRLDYRKVIGLIAGFAGIIFINSGEDFSLEFSWLGEGFMILSGLVSALGTILAKRISQEVHPFVLTAWQMLLGSLLLIMAGLPGLRPHTLNVTHTALILLVYSAFLSATAFSLWYAILKYNKAGEISVYKFMTPVSGSILSALLIPKEHLSANMFVALLLVALGIIVVNHQGKSRKTTP
ncbi:DMT(drug/metabolite transporter) superfamily permease [Desulfosporosinus orientis DSM 765]|uniref:DMT(Drug/metabolite transporter) superfamily permease n=1 Tax=Desulfosporosinus orientis (strain ATCC 19365 / DSM 765 / NCIMB 8382 / VKM B-1628 / Singapore I) TaxID=768706 RepID=G7WE42_DESOD|nr:DMT family transporter [Desulfosporosinus orientis]AET69440.1 DMT(drug/metabolite transporter) superfamily permease [Desulfosporosinus orientis DSM 765]